MDKSISDRNIDYEKYLLISDLKEREQIFIMDVISYIFEIKRTIDEPLSGVYWCDDWKYIIMKIIPNDPVFLFEYIYGNKYILYDKRIEFNFKMISNWRNNRRSDSKGNLLITSGAGEKMDFILDILLLHYYLFIMAIAIDLSRERKKKWHYSFTRFLYNDYEKKLEEINETGDFLISRYGRVLRKETVRNIYVSYGFEF